MNLQTCQVLMSAIIATGALATHAGVPHGSDSQPNPKSKSHFQPKRPELHAPPVNPSPLASEQCRSLQEHCAVWSAQVGNDPVMFVASQVAEQRVLEGSGARPGLRFGGDLSREFGDVLSILKLALLQGLFLRGGPRHAGASRGSAVGSLLRRGDREGPGEPWASDLLPKRQGFRESLFQPVSRWTCFWCLSRLS